MTRIQASSLLISSYSIAQGGSIMRLTELPITEEGLLAVDIMELPESCVIVLSNGVAKVAALPAYAETKIVTHQGQVKRLRFDEGVEF